MSESFRTTPPAAGEFAPYYDRYISAVPEGDILTSLTSQNRETLGLLAGISDERAMFSYAPGKWNIKEMLGHMIDGERVFSYRALRIARADKTPLPGFEQDDYVRSGNFSSRALADLAEEFAHVRISTLDLFSHFNEEAWLRRGTASTFEVSVRALAWIIAGHERHHVAILKERYLK